MSSRRLCECILFAGLLFLSFRHFDDADGWWHLKTGQLIFENGSIPHSDVYSETRSGNEWITHEWLAQFLTFALYRAGGFGLVNISYCLVATAGFWAAYLRCPGRPFVAAIPLMMGAGAASPMLGARPQVISLLLVSIFVAIQERYAASQNTRYLWMLAGVMLLWANLHGAFVLGPLLLVLQMAGLIVERILFGAQAFRSQLARLGLALAGCTAVIVLNPSGIKLYKYAAQTVSRSTEQMYLADWASPDFHLFRFQLFAALLLGFLVVLALCKEKIRPGSILVFSVFAFLGLQSVRHIPIFAVVAVPIIVAQLSLLLKSHGAIDRAMQSSSSELPRLNLLIAGLVVLLIGYRFASFIQSEEAAERELFPRAAVDFIHQNQIRGPIFNLYEWGGYLIWNLYPELKVFVDGRPEIYGDDYIRQYANTYFGRQQWQEPLERFRVQTVLVKPDAPLASLLRQAGDWRSVFEDKVAVVFVRAAPNTETAH